MNYLKKKSFATSKFKLDFYPYVAVPDNVFEDGIALQYGADFKVEFKKGSASTSEIGIIQLIFPQTKIFENTNVKAWNVDKRQQGTSSVTFGKCLYSENGVKIGSHSKYYEGTNTRFLSKNECWITDTPREINRGFNNGIFSGNTKTKFANYVVELSSKQGFIYDDGIVWNYEFVQARDDKYKFDIAMGAPQSVKLSKHNEHIKAIASFLGIEIEEAYKLLKK